MQTGNSEMNLFKEVNNVEILGSLIDRVTKENGYRLIKGDKKWVLFKRDEQVVRVVINQNGNTEEVQLSVTLFSDIGVGMEIFIRNVLLDRKIRLMTKQDQFRKRNCNIELLRILKLKTNSLKKEKISKQIKMITNKAKRIKKEADDLLDYTMFIKLN